MGSETLLSFFFHFVFLLIPSMEDVNTSLLVISTISLLLLFILLYILCRRCFKRIESIHDLPRPVHGYSFNGKVKSVGDGDGFRVIHLPRMQSCIYGTGHATLSIRLAGVDAPEMRFFGYPAQPHAKESQRFLKKLIFNKEVHITILSIDTYQRLISIVHINDGLINYKNINLELVKAGAACVYKGAGAEYGEMEQALKSAERLARKNKLGMWANKNVVLPMDYKKQKYKSRGGQTIK